MLMEGHVYRIPQHMVQKSSTSATLLTGKLLRELNHGSLGNIPSVSLRNGRMAVGGGEGPGLFTLH